MIKLYRFLGIGALALVLSFGMAAKAQAITLDDLWNEVTNLKSQIVELKSQLSATVISSRESTSTALSTRQSSGVITEVEKDASFQPITTLTNIDPTKLTWDSDTTNSTQPSQTGSTINTTTAVNQKPVVSGTTSLFTRTLKYQERGEEVKILQNLLVKLGYLSENKATGLYGDATKAAVIKFQKEKGIVGNGTIVGPSTQAALKNSNSSASSQIGPFVPNNLPPPCLNNGVPTVTVISPNGGEVYQAGQQITVKWTTCNLPSTSTVVLTLFSFAPGSQIIPVGISTVNDGNETFTLPQVGTGTGYQSGTWFKILVAESISGGLSSPTVRDFSNSNFAIVSSQACTASVSLDATTPPSGQVLVGTNDVKFTRVFISANNCDIKLNKLVVGFGGTINPNLSLIQSSIRNVRLFYANTQSQIGTTVAVPTFANSFYPNITIPAGAGVLLEIRADVIGGAGNTASLGVMFTDAINTVTNTQVGNGYQYFGNPMNIVAAQPCSVNSLQVAKNTAYSNQTVTPGTTHFKIGSYVISNGCTTEAVRLSNLQVLLTGSSGLFWSNLTNLQAYLGGTQLGSTIPTVYSVNNISLGSTSILPGSQAIIDLYADIGSTTSGWFETSLLPTAIGQSSGSLFTPSSVAVGQKITIGAAQYCSLSVIPVQLPSTGLVNGVATSLYKVRITNTSSTADCRITSMQFHVEQSTGVTVSDLLLFDDISQITNSASLNGNQNVLWMGLNSVITPGVSKSYFLKANLQGVSNLSGNSYVTSSLSSVGGLDLSNGTTFNMTIPTVHQTITN